MVIEQDKDTNDALVLECAKAAYAKLRKHIPFDDVDYDFEPEGPDYPENTDQYARANITVMVDGQVYWATVHDGAHNTDGFYSDDYIESESDSDWDPVVARRLDEIVGYVEGS